MSVPVDPAVAIDYAAVLAELERRKLQLESAIAAIEWMLKDQRPYEDGTDGGA